VGNSAFLSSFNGYLGVPIKFQQGSLASSHVEAWNSAFLFSCSALSASTSSLSKLRRKLDSFYASQEAPQDTRHNTRRKPCSLSQLEKNPVFPNSSRDEGRFPCFDSRGVLTFHSRLKRRPVSPIETPEEPLVACCNLKGHQVPTQLEITPDFSASTRMNHRVSTHNAKGGLTSLLNL